MLSLQKSKLEDDDSFTVDLTARADSPVAAVPHTRPGRLKKPVQYLEESDEDDMFWIFMEILNCWSKFIYKLAVSRALEKLSPKNSISGWEIFSLNLS